MRCDHICKSTARTCSGLPVFSEYLNNCTRVREVKVLAKRGGVRGMDLLPHEHGSDQPQTLPKCGLDDPRHFMFRCPKRKQNVFFLRNLIGRLPPEDGSDGAQTLPKSVSDDPQHLVFRH